MKNRGPFLTGLIGIAIFALASGAHLARADGIEATPDAVTDTVQEHVLETPIGPEHYTLIEGVNANGEREVEIQHEEIRALIPGETRVTVLYGRDLDGDGVIDAWFYADEDGVIDGIDTAGTAGATDVPTASEPTPEPHDPWEQASKILIERSQYKNRWFAGVAADAILSRITLTQGMGDAFQKSFTQEELDLRDLELRVNRLERQDPRDPDLGRYYLLLADGWEDLSRQVSSEGIRQRFIDGAGDFAMYVGGAALAKGLGKLAELLIPRVMATSSAAWASSVYARISSAFASEAEAALARLGDRASQLGLSPETLAKLRQNLRLPPLIAKITGIAGVEGASQAIHDLFTETLPTVLRGLDARGQIARLLAKSGSLIQVAAKAALRQWKYIALSQSLQLGIEVWERRDALFSPNPITFAKNIATNKDLIQDLGYMTWDSTVQTGISAADPNLKRRMVVCGIFSFIDSTSVSLLVNDSTDPARQALDTSWEMTVGNAETQIDLASLKAFEKLALRSNNPKLELIGYAAVIADDGFGYWAYEKATSGLDRLEKKNKGKPMLQWVPIFGEIASSSGADQ